MKGSVPEPPVGVPPPKVTRLHEEPWAHVSPFAEAAEESTSADANTATRTRVLFTTIFSPVEIS